MFTFVGGIKMKLNAEGLRQISRGFKNYFNEIPF